MSIEASHDNAVLRRKIRTERAADADQAVPPGTALRTSLARAADHVISLALNVSAARQRRLELDPALERLKDTEPWAYFSLPHEDETTGALCLDAALVSALVDQQTIGFVSEEAAARALTRTDLALAQPVLDRCLGLFNEIMREAPTAFWTGGYFRAEPLPNKHALSLRLDAPEYRVFEFDVGFKRVQRRGRLILMLPVKQKEPLGTFGAIQGGGVETDGAAGEGKRAGSLRAAVLPARVELDAVLARVEVSLAKLQSLEPGALLDVPRHMLQEARLEDAGQATSTKIELGQLNGMRAARLKSGASGRQERASEAAPLIADGLAEGASNIQTAPVDPVGLTGNELNVSEALEQMSDFEPVAAPFVSEEI